MKKGLLIIYSGPSGVGKGTVLKEFMKDESLNLKYSVSMTTRKPRNQEIEGVNYFFVTKEDFKKAIANDEILEYAEFVGNYYGTPKSFVEEQRLLGYNVILEIEVDGAKQVMKNCKDAISIFIVPPSLEELEQRIRNRKTEDEEVIKKRLAKARREIEDVNLYDYVVCNDRVEDAAKIISKIITANINAIDKNDVKLSVKDIECSLKLKDIK